MCTDLYFTVLFCAVNCLPFNDFNIKFPEFQKTDVTFLFRPDGNLKDINIGAFLDFRREPPEEYENLRRRVYSNTKELWYYVKNELGQMMKEEARLEKIKDIVEEIGNRKR